MLNAKRQAEDYARALPAVARLAALHPRLRRRPLHRGLCRLLRAGEELHPVPGPAGLPHLSRRSAQARGARAAAAHLERPACRSTRRRTSAQGHARHRRAARRRVEGAGGQAPSGRGRRAFPDALPVHDVRRGRRAAAGKIASRTCWTTAANEPGSLRAAASTELWEAMDDGDFAHAHPQPRCCSFNGELFKDARGAAARPRGDRRTADGREQRLARGRAGDLRHAAGTGARPRRTRAGSARTTRRAPMSSGWWSRPSSSRCARTGATCRRTAETLRGDGRRQGRAPPTVQAFHDKLCETRVLDPACGTGNFLYVSLELMKRLEGEVLEALLDLGGQEALRGLDAHTRRSAPVPRPRAQSARRGDRRTGAVDRLSAMAFPHQGRARRPSRSCARSRTSRSRTRC